MIQARMDLTVKFSAIPESQTTDGRVVFAVEVAGRAVHVSVKAKAWRKVLDAERDAPGRWVCAVSGKMGPARGNGFELAEAGLQVFIRSVKEGEAAKVEQPTTAPPTLPATPPPPTPAAAPSAQYSALGERPDEEILGHGAAAPSPSPAPPAASPPPPPAPPKAHTLAEAPRHTRREPVVEHRRRPSREVEAEFRAAGKRWW